MSSYWAEFAYHGSPGRGRDGTLPEWRAWSDAPNGDKFVTLDGDSDGGIRMNNKAVTFDVLKERLLADTSFPDSAAKGEIYDCVFRGREQWDESEFQKLGGNSCTIPIFEFLRL
jgi:para-nitrobenzyl esterase